MEALTKYDFTATEKDELSFAKDTTIRVSVTISIVVIDVVLSELVIIIITDQGSLGSRSTPLNQEAKLLPIFGSDRFKYLLDAPGMSGNHHLFPT